MPQPFPLTGADPHAFLVALRASLDGLNPDRQQLEKQRHRPVLLAALRAQGRSAAMLFPELSLWLDASSDADGHAVQRFDNTQAEARTGAAGHAFSEQPSPFIPPKFAPSARPARGTPVSVSCNRGLSPFPTSWRAALVLSALWFGIKGNGALTQRKQRP